MKITEIVLALLSLGALAFNIAVGGDTAAWICLACLGSLALFYLLFAALLLNHTTFALLLDSKPNEAHPGWGRVAWAFVAGIVFALSVCGILFAQNGWRLAPFFWTAGMLLLVPVGAVSLAKHMLQQSLFYRGIATRAALLLLCGILVIVLQWQPPQ